MWLRRTQGEFLRIEALSLAGTIRVGLKAIVFRSVRLPT
jgi:hypothetical protein